MEKRIKTIKNTPQKYSLLQRKLDKFILSLNDCDGMCNLCRPSLKKRCFRYKGIEEEHPSYSGSSKPTPPAPVWWGRTPIISIILSERAMKRGGEMAIRRGGDEANWRTIALSHLRIRALSDSVYSRWQPIKRNGDEASFALNIR